MRAWLDVDNPPQAQYLCPFALQMRASDRPEPVVTARNYGTTVALVRQKGIEPRVFGAAAGAGRASKAWVTLRRAALLAAHVQRQHPRPSYLISSSRSSALAARLLGLPAYVFCDYEHAELGLYRRLGATILHPDAIPADHFRGLGFAPDKLHPFPGLKEDISFAFTDVAATPPLPLPEAEGAVRVLLRPPASRSHYYQDASGDLYEQIIAELATRSNVQVVLSPRYPEQARAALALDWARPPVVLDNEAEFVALLKSVDVVVSSGGTMLREAAFLGIHACSIFLGPRGAVDQRLAAEGRLTFVTDLAAFRACELRRKDVGSPLQRHPRVLEQIIHGIEANLAG